MQHMSVVVDLMLLNYRPIQTLTQKNELKNLPETLVLHQMKETFYRKVGRRYVPVKEYDDELLHSFSKGVHLVVCQPGSTMYSHNIDPEFAPMIAAGIYARDAISRAIVEASNLRPARQPITPEQRSAWQNFADSLGDYLATLNGASAHDITQAGVDAMVAEADKLMKNESVRKAYEHFLLMAKLAQENEK